MTAPTSLSTSGLRRAVCLAAALLAAPVAATASETRVGLAYRFYVGGVKVGKATVSAIFAGGKYEIRSWASTTGAAGMFFEAEINTVAKGAVANGVARPAIFKLDTLSAKKPQDLVMRYEKNRPASIEAKPPFGKRSYQLDPKRQVGTVDPLSAGVLAVLTSSRTNGDLCKLKMPIFDGRRRYDVTLERVLDRDVDGGRPTVDCEARFKRVGGFKPKHMKLPDYVFTVRAKIRADGIAVPLRAWGATPFGAALVSLRK